MSVPTPLIVLAGRLATAAELQAAFELLPP